MNNPLLEKELDRFDARDEELRLRAENLRSWMQQEEALEEDRANVAALPKTSASNNPGTNLVRH